MNVDVLGEQAAHALRDTARFNTESGLQSLMHLDRRRTRQHRVGGVIATLLVASAAWLGMLGLGSQPRPQPLPAPTFGPIDPSYDVVDTDVSRAGDAEALATFRDGLTAVVLVRTSADDAVDVVWSAPTEHEVGDRNLPWPAAVSWAPDGSKLAVLVAQERGRPDESKDPVELTLVTLNRDGTHRMVVGIVGACWCSDTTPTVTWSVSDRVEINVPDGPDEGRYTEEIR